MDKSPLDRARIEALTRYVVDHQERLSEAARAVLVDADGQPLPFVLMMPTEAGTFTVANMPDGTVRAVVRVLAESMEQEALRQMFINAIAGMARIVPGAKLTPVDDDDDSGKVH